MFKKILIANRGEIACRVIRTCQKLNIRTVVLFSEPDAQAPHVRMADEAIALSGKTAAETYLQQELIVQAALHSGAEGIHPGYGFLSENASFARLCQEQGVVFIGPSPQTIESMGNKAQAKTLMQAAKVPVVPGWSGADQSLENLKQQAERVGFPLMVKAVDGGGGKGMRVVNSPDEFESQLQAAQREAQAAFGNADVLLERFLPSPRHIEFQIFGDRHGNQVHLFERECSVQRRHQKIVEECPSPFLSQELRRAMGEVAVAAARATQYEGAGTVEFIMDQDKHFYFMEMNTRLQVEHPVTEMVTGLDLVEWQLKVACGEALPLQQHEILQTGHALEARLYAENPENGFLPSTGTLQQWHLPQQAAGLRVDSGVAAGNEISVYYDPMIAKLIVHAPDRQHCLERMSEVLWQTAVSGLHTNLAFLRKLIDHPAFAAAQVDTTFVDRQVDELTQPPPSLPGEAALLATLCLLEQEAQEAETLRQQSPEPNSPWHQRDHWRLNLSAHRRFIWQDAQARETHVILSGQGQNFQWQIQDCSRTVRLIAYTPPLLQIQVEELYLSGVVLDHEGTFQVSMPQGRFFLKHITGPLLDSVMQDQQLQIKSPMPGKILKIHRQVGETVKLGDPLLVLEAMKMEHTIKAQQDGQIEAIHFGVGELVQAEATLLNFKS